MANRPVRIAVRNNRQIVCPVRFVRAVTGDVQDDAPDPDDRGFAMGTRPGTWNESLARGAMVGITTGQEVRLKVLREDIDDQAELYVTSSRPDIVSVTAPAGGGPLPGDGVFRIQAHRDIRRDELGGRPVAIQVRLGAADGPVLGELEPHVFNQRQIRLTFHFVTIYGTATNRLAATAADRAANIDPLVSGANRIWRPGGIWFTYSEARVPTEEVRRNPATNRTEYRRTNGTWAPLPGPLGAAGQFVNAGALTSDPRWGAAAEYREFDTMKNINPIANTVNVYCVHDSFAWSAADNRYNNNDWLGLSDITTVAEAGQPGYGLALTDDADHYALAHELGHYLGNYHSDMDAANNDVANGDMWICRRLMYSSWPPDAPEPAWRQDVGYGHRAAAALIAVKDLPDAVERQDGEIARSRPRARRPY